MADADVAMTRALLHLARAARNGILPTQALGSDWTISTPPVDIVPALAAAVASGTLRSAFDAFAPQDPQYNALSKALAAYRDIERRGGWKTLTKADDAALLRDRLAMEGYDTHASLPRAIAFFQGTHNLEPTGQVDAATLAALNVPVDARLAQIAVNLERWRHLPHDFGHEYVLVDAADARMTLFQDGEPTLSMRTVLGDRQHATPVLAATITAVTFNPHWDIPVSIATREVLPMLKKDPNYLAENDIIISDGPAKGSAGAYIDWQQFSAHAFPMHLRQRSGPGNALGAIKFEMPNSEDIYLHDTPARWVFNEPDRRFSHGCVRLEHPEQLAARLLPPREWSEKAIDGAIAARTTRTVALEKPVPVYVLYATVVADDDGRVIFRDDPYGRDPALATALGLHLSEGAREQTKARLPLAP
jgi:murein L,D-transpeptidase YcbB/YkuD